MYICNIIIPKVWTSLESLIQVKVPTFTFEYGKNYRFFHNNNEVYHIIDYSSKPDDSLAVGKTIRFGIPPIIYNRGTGSLYVKSVLGNANIEVCDDL